MDLSLELVPDHYLVRRKYHLEVSVYEEIHHFCLLERDSSIVVPSGVVLSLEVWPPGLQAPDFVNRLPAFWHLISTCILIEHRSNAGPLPYFCSTD